MQRSDKKEKPLLHTMIQEVLVFGDSIVMGLWDEQGGWAERLWKGRSRIVYNLGVDGNTSDDVAARFLSEARARGIRKNSVVIFAVGANDSSRMNSAHRVELAKYSSNMSDLIDNAKRYTEKIYCVGIGPIDQSKTVPFILEKSISFYTADKNEYDMALEKLCRTKGVEYISLRDSGVEQFLSEDGVHPLTPGHAIIAQKVLDSLSLPAEMAIQ